MSGTPNPEAVAQEASPPTQAPRTRSQQAQSTLDHIALINAQAAKGLLPPKSPKQRLLASELQASTKKAKEAHDQVELAEVIAQQTQTQPASAYS